ncbi:MAG: calcium-binding protein, partial [Oscillatoriales cyanobacterium RM1_1_9]|nr:calcium-binding protein [Oscillatoriales cyanobacterium RM1_1_9]
GQYLFGSAPEELNLPAGLVIFVRGDAVNEPIAILEGITELDLGGDIDNPNSPIRFI